MYDVPIWQKTMSQVVRLTLTDVLNRYCRKSEERCKIEVRTWLFSVSVRIIFCQISAFLI